VYNLDVCDLPRHTESSALFITLATLSHYIPSNLPSQEGRTGTVWELPQLLSFLLLCNK